MAPAAPRSLAGSAHGALRWHLPCSGGPCAGSASRWGGCGSPPTAHEGGPHPTLQSVVSAGRPSAKLEARAHVTGAPRGRGGKLGCSRTGTSGRGVGLEEGHGPERAPPRARTARLRDGSPHQPPSGTRAPAQRSRRYVWGSPEWNGMEWMWELEYICGQQDGSPSGLDVKCFFLLSENFPQASQLGVRTSCRLVARKPRPALRPFSFAAGPPSPALRPGTRAQRPRKKADCAREPHLISAEGGACAGPGAAAQPLKSWRLPLSSFLFSLAGPFV